LADQQTFLLPVNTRCNEQCADSVQVSDAEFHVPMK